MKERINVYFPPELLRRLIDLSERKRVSRSAIVEAAVSSLLSPDGSERMEAALARRLDRMSRQVQRLERDLTIGTETLALFVRFWLTVTPALPPEAQASAQARGRERFENFVETLGRRLSKGTHFLQDVPFEGFRSSESPAVQAEPLPSGEQSMKATRAGQDSEVPE